MLKKLILSTAFVVMATAASADPLTLSVGGGGWSGAVAPAGVCVDPDNQSGTLQDEIRWGGGHLESDPAKIASVPSNLVDLGYTTGGDACWITNATYDLDDVAAVSGYNFDPFEGTYTFPGAASPFALGTFQHLNQPISDAITAVNYDLTINHNATSSSLGGPAPGGPLGINLAFTHNETDNVGPSTCCDDIVTVVVPTAATLFVVNQSQYQFQLLGFSTTGLPGTFTNMFTSPEYGTNTTQLWAQVTPVPEPATLTLLGSGLLGLGAAARRRYRKAKAAAQPVV